MNKKVGENKPKTSLIISLVVLVIIIALVIAVFIINYEDNEYNNENLYNYNSYKTYEEFNKEFSEYNTDFDISKNNYYEYEKDLFSLKYSSKIGEEHYYKKAEEAQLLNYEKNELYIFLTNNSDLEVLDAKLSIIYYDKNGNIIDTENEIISGLEKNVQTCNVIKIDSKRVNDVKIIINAKESNRNKALIQNIKTEVVDTDREFKLRYTNESEYKLKSIDGIIVFYDEENKIVSSSSIYLYDGLNKNSSKEEKVHIFNKEYNNYKVFINSINV